MVGSYDGSGNYGDVLQFAASLRMVRRLESAPLPVAILERATLDHHAVLVAEFPELFEGAAFAHFADAADPGGDGLVPLEAGRAPSASALYLYGGGYLNRWWGQRKADLADAAERLSASDGALPLIASGLQVEADSVAPGGSAHALLSRASHLGARDIGSLELMRALARARTRVELVADDAIPLLEPGVPIDDSTVNVHLNAGSWVEVEPAGLARFLCAIGREARMPLSLRPVIAYEDPRVSETEQMQSMLRRHGPGLEAAGLTPSEPIHALAEAADDGFASLRRARLTVSCSYHVALTSLLAGIPTVLLAENGYYDQKAAGLRHLFELGPGLVGVHGERDDATAAAAVLADGPSRDALVAHLRRRSPEVVGLQARGREAVAAALERSLRGPRSTPARARSLIRRLVAR